METKEKTFRYSYIFKNLAVLYLIFLALIIALVLISKVYLLLSPMIVLGIILVILYLNTRVYISDEGITTKTVLGTKSLKWSEIGRAASDASLLRLQNYDGNVSLSVDSRVDGYQEIFNLIYRKRSDLFDVGKNASASQSVGETNLKTDWNKTAKPDEQIFRYPLGILIVIVSLVIGSCLLLSREGYLSILAGIGLIVGWYYSSMSLRISDEEIISSGLFGTKILKWSDIDHVSIRGQTLSFHNRGENLRLSVNASLTGYENILDLIFRKRPDLFDAGEEFIMSRSLVAGFFEIVCGLLFAVFGVYSFLFIHQGALGLIFSVAGLYFIVAWSLTPTSIILDNQALHVVYLSKIVSYKAKDIRSIYLKKKETDRRELQFIQVNLKGGQTLKLSIFKYGSALLPYRVLKRWHEKAT